MQLSVRVTGGSQLEREFRRIGDAVLQTRLMEIAGRAGGVILMQEVHQRTPIWENNPPPGGRGALYRSLRFDVDAQPERVTMRVEPQHGYDYEYHGRDQDPVDYDPLIEEHGTPLGRAKGYKEEAEQAAIPGIRQTIIAILKAAIEGREAIALNIGRRPGGGTF